jgi:hypothetical protein
LTWDRYGSPISGNFIGNYHKLGPNSLNYSPKTYSLRLYCADGDCNYSMFVKDNLSILRQTDGLNDGLVVRVDSGVNSNWLANTRINTSNISITNSSAGQAYNDVLAPGGAGNSKYIDCSGNWINRRDSIDSRVVLETQSGTAFEGTKGKFIDDEQDVGGWLSISKGTACAMETAMVCQMPMRQLWGLTLDLQMPMAMPIKTVTQI